jgi:hypothetical protein
MIRFIIKSNNIYTFHEIQMTNEELRIRQEELRNLDA